MQKLMKNWIVTLVLAIVLLLLAVWMLLDGVGVADRFVTQGIIHEITAVFVACYAVLVLCPMVPRYVRVVRFFALAEIAVLVLTVAGIFFNTVSEIRWIEQLVLCSVVGLVIFLRCAVELIAAYMSTDVLKPPLWRFCAYILFAAVGVWQMADPLIGNRYLIFPISGLTLLIAAGFALRTVRNYRAARVAAKAAEAPTKGEEALKVQPESSEQPASNESEALAQGTENDEKDA
ncbi:MAG: hypothetical protein IKM08_09865 [Clostridia bacterium]|nr:hypothetical protein [Clostridia bacterium]